MPPPGNVIFLRLVVRPASVGIVQVVASLPNMSHSLAATFFMVRPTQAQPFVQVTIDPVDGDAVGPPDTDTAVLTSRKCD